MAGVDPEYSSKVKARHIAEVGQGGSKDANIPAQDGHTNSVELIMNKNERENENDTLTNVFKG